MIVSMMCSSNRVILMHRAWNFEQLWETDFLISIPSYHVDVILINSLFIIVFNGFSPVISLLKIPLIPMNLWNLIRSRSEIFKYLHQKFFFWKDNYIRTSHYSSNFKASVCCTKLQWLLLLLLFCPSFRYIFFTSNISI